MEDTNIWIHSTNKFQGLINSEDPSDFKQKCLRLCQQYLAGNWTKLTADDMEIKRLTGGMMNKVYHCRIPDNLRDNSNEPKEVAIRLFGERHDYKTLEVTDNTLEANIKNVLLSENGFGPKVYGVAQTGTVQKYYHHRHFAVKDLYDKDLLDEIAIKLARLHAMKPPIDKTRATIRDVILSTNKIFNQKLNSNQKLFEENNCNTLLNCDLKAETDWILSKIQNFDSPIVFSHNDFRFGNTMITKEDGVVIGDYDLTDYFYRGYDFATFFTDFMKLDKNSFGFKDESIVRSFIGKYLTESAIINGKQYLDNKINSIEHIVSEMKVLKMVYSALLFNGLQVIWLWNLPIDHGTILQICDSELKTFLAIKKLLGNF